MEYVLRMSDAWLNRNLQQVAFALTSARMVVFETARVVSVLGVRERLVEDLRSAEERPEGAADRIAGELLEVARQAGMMPEEAESEKAGDEVFFRNATRQAIRLYGNCRAVVAGDMALCRLLDFDQEVVAECRKQVFNVDFYGRGRCASDNLQELAESMGTPLETIEKACRILSAREIERCGEMGRWQAICRAILSGDEKECRQAGQEEDMRACLETMQGIRILRGADTAPEGIEANDRLREAAGWLSRPERCPHLALDEFGKLSGKRFSLLEAAP